MLCLQTHHSHSSERILHCNFQLCMQHWLFPTIYFSFFLSSPDYSTFYSFTIPPSLLLSSLLSPSLLVPSSPPSLPLPPSPFSLSFPPSFLKSRPNLEEFLGKLLHFQHFRQFINGRIDKLKEQSLERDLFDNEVLMYEEGEDVRETWN